MFTENKKINNYVDFLLSIDNKKILHVINIEEVGKITEISRKDIISNKNWNEERCQKFFENLAIRGAKYQLVDETRALIAFINSIEEKYPNNSNIKTLCTKAKNDFADVLKSAIKSNNFNELNSLSEKYLVISTVFQQITTNDKQWKYN